MCILRMNVFVTTYVNHSVSTMRTCPVRTFIMQVSSIEMSWARGSPNSRFAWQSSREFSEDGARRSGVAGSLLIIWNPRHQLLDLLKNATFFKERSLCNMQLDMQFWYCCYRYYWFFKYCSYYNSECFSSYLYEYYSYHYYKNVIYL